MKIETNYKELTITARNEKLKHLIACMKCEVSGKECDENCPTQYGAGNMGEIIENLEAISKALEQEPVLDKIKAEIEALPKTYPFVNHIDMYVKEDDVKKIIDEYKVESEDKE